MPRVPGQMCCPIPIHKELFPYTFRCGRSAQISCHHDTYVYLPPHSHGGKGKSLGAFRLTQKLISLRYTNFYIMSVSLARQIEQPLHKSLEISPMALWATNMLLFPQAGGLLAIWLPALNELESHMLLAIQTVRLPVLQMFVFVIGRDLESLMLLICMNQGT
jgi:hypothetical protein